MRNRESGSTISNRLIISIRKCNLSIGQMLAVQGLAHTFASATPCFENTCRQILWPRAALLSPTVTISWPNAANRARDKSCRCSNHGYVSTHNDFTYRCTERNHVKWMIELVWIFAKPRPRFASTFSKRILERLSFYRVHFVTVQYHPFTHRPHFAICFLDRLKMDRLHLQGVWTEFKDRSCSMKYLSAMN